MTITIPDSSLPAWQARLSKSFPANTPTVEAFIQSLTDEETASAERQLATNQREALIPVANEILAASPAKQQAAIAAALQAVRS